MSKAKIYLSDDCIAETIIVDRVVNIPIKKLCEFTGFVPASISLEYFKWSCHRSSDNKKFVLPTHIQREDTYDLYVYGEHPETASDDSDESCSSATSGSSASMWHGLTRFHYKYEYELHQEAYQFLVSGKLPTSQKTRQALKHWKANIKRRFIIGKDGKLFRKRDPDNLKSFSTRQYAKRYPLLEVVTSTKAAMKLIQERHSVVHDGRDRILRTFNNFYLFHGIKKIITQVCNDCDICQEFQGKMPKLTEAIITEFRMQLVMFDLTMLPFTDEEGYKVLFLMKDHFTKFHWALPLKSKQAEPITKFLLDTFRTFGAPHAYHSDNGGEFINERMAEVMKIMGCEHKRGKPRHPQTQGLIERANATVKSKIQKLAREEGWTQHGQNFEWRQYLDRVINNENTCPLRLYGGLNAFLCFHGREQTQVGSKSETWESTEVDKMHEYMRQCQITAAGKKFQFTHYHHLEIGQVVMVQATPKELKDKIAIGKLSAKGVIHQQSPKNVHYYKVRWLTKGLSMGKTRSSEPGSISAYYGRLQMKPITGSNEDKMAVVYQSQHGHVMITTRFQKEDPPKCNYVYLNGDFKDTLYSTDMDWFKGKFSMSYKAYLEWEEQERKENMEIIADVSEDELLDIKDVQSENPTPGDSSLESPKKKQKISRIPKKKASSKAKKIRVKKEPLATNSKRDQKAKDSNVSSKANEKASVPAKVVSKRSSNSQVHYYISL